MAKFCFCINHAWINSTGGCETIVQQLAELVISKGHSCHVLATNMNSVSNYQKNNLTIQGCGQNPQQFLNIVNSIKPDHLMVYSDLFAFWHTIVENSEKINCKKYIVLVGMNRMFADNNLFNLFQKKCNQFITITHSEYIDYKNCKIKNINPLTVIPLDINYDCFYSSPNIEFKKKYNITGKNIVLCVANFYPGKGQEFLPKILQCAYEGYPNFEVVFISSKINAAFAQIISGRLNWLMKESGVPYKIIQGIPREDVIQSFYECDLFLCPSQKEVGPIVLLEAMAAGKPWISLPVGHYDLLKGGKVVNAPVKDKDNNCVYTKPVNDEFCEHIIYLLKHKEESEKLGQEGKNRIDEYFSWDKISSKYEELFNIK